MDILSLLSYLSTPRFSIVSRNEANSTIVSKEEKLEPPPTALRQKPAGDFSNMTMNAPVGVRKPLMIYTDLFMKNKILHEPSTERDILNFLQDLFPRLSLVHYEVEKITPVERPQSCELMSN